MTVSTLVRALIGIALVVHAPAFADTKFTYQGELGENGQLAEGEFSMRFSLWDAVAGGRQIGSTVILNPVSVADGRFAVELDYGAEAFDGSGRWLEITVDGITLSPRQQITRSPYSIQTRGIFVDENENVGIGTTDPQTALHVDGSVWSTGPEGGFFTSFNPTNQSAAVSLSWLNDVARLRIGGSGPGADGGLDIQRTGNASLMRILHDGSVGIGTTAPAAKLDVVGNGNFSGRLGVGDPDVLYGQLTIADSGDGSIFALAANSDNSAFPTIFANNAAANGPAIWAQGNSDASPSGGGLIVSGDQAGLNISIDNNEIMARNNGSPSSLFVNAEGGAIRMGQYGIRPALAYLSYRGGGAYSGSSNITSFEQIGIGRYRIRAAGGFSSSDVIIVTPNIPVPWFAGGQVDGGDLLISTHNEGGDPGNVTFSVVVYRP